jgi:DNA repair exonuclease SbcCD ATPase subunit
VYGDNGEGKTTIFDGFCWCLFGKNSNGDAKFNIKPLNADGTEVSGVDCIVTVVLEKDGIETSFTRNYHEVWKTPRGKAEKIFDGHKTDYLVNEGNISQKLYQERVNDIIDEKVFKMLTDVYAFTSMKDKEQREVLFKVLGGDIPVEEIISSNKKLEPLTKLLETTKLEFLESETKGQIKKNKDEKEKIPARIDELENMKVWVDVVAKQTEIDQVKDETAKLDKQIEIAKKLDQEILNNRNELLAKENKFQNEYSKAKNEAEKKYIDSKYESLELKKKEYDEEYSKIKDEIDKKYDNTKNIEALNKANDQLNQLKNKMYSQTSLKNQYTREISDIDNHINFTRKQVLDIGNSKFVFDESKAICPTCHRPFGNIEKDRKALEDNFNKGKETELNELKIKGNKYISDKKAKVEAL